MGFAARRKVPYTFILLGFNGIIMSQDFTPGMLVRHPTEPDWGTGQVQSAIGDRITVNFQHRGKVLINGARITLVILGDEDSGAKT
jgi:hypothetical protein